ncbi:MAG: FKBP-type peptidyl-prolyl cis-trans isomerase [Bacteroidaceae bacterium]|nr:FKBP-type peptidyl-prolyl cis-trans isomerase [Bacteroidaceae bacterium]
METNNKYITVAYKLYAGQNGKSEFVEEATKEHPYQFISGMGIVLPAFEAQIAGLNSGDKFNFTLPCAEAYGEYSEDYITSLPKEEFTRDGKFLSEYIYPGAIVPLVNGAGMQFEGIVVEITETDVVIDANLRMAGKDLTYTGEVVESRPATNEEIQGMINMLSGEGCGCACGSCGGGCGGDCDDEGCGCGGHCH